MRWRQTQLQEIVAFEPQNSTRGAPGRLYEAWWDRDPMVIWRQVLAMNPAHAEARDRRWRTSYVRMVSDVRPRWLSLQARSASWQEHLIETVGKPACRSCPAIPAAGSARHRLRLASARSNRRVRSLQPTRLRRRTRGCRLRPPRAAACGVPAMREDLCPLSARFQAVAGLLARSGEHGPELQTRRGVGGLLRRGGPEVGRPALGRRHPRAVSWSTLTKWLTRRRPRPARCAGEADSGGSPGQRRGPIH